MSSQFWHLAWILPAVLAIVYLGSPRHAGQMTFRRVKRLLEHSLDGRRFSQFHGLVLPTGGGKELLDHVVVSRSGISVIVSEDFKGKVRGGESQEFWREERFGKVRQRPNPLVRARLQMETLQGLLELPREYFQLMVAVEGQQNLSSNLPGQVVSVERLADRIKTRSTERFTAEQADGVVRRIEEKRLSGGGRRGTLAAQLALGAAVLLGVYVVYGPDLRAVMSDFDGRLERLSAPERFDEQGRRKSEQTLFEESLNCAYSSDTARCACYGKDGEKVEIELSKCRDLAERGSILKQ